jgi:hypothetical protein
MYHQGMNNIPVGGRSSETSSHPINVTRHEHRLQYRFGENGRERKPDRSSASQGRYLEALNGGPCHHGMACPRDVVQDLQI